MLLANTAEGGSNGTTVTTGNSGGTSGTAWDSVTIGASAALIFTTTNPAHGSLAYRFSTGASSVNCTLNWIGSIGTAVPTCWFRMYVFTPSSFANTPAIMRFQGSGTQACRIAWDASGHILIRNTANTLVATSTTALSTSTAYRIEGFCTVGASGTAEIKIFTSVDSTTVTETLTAASQNYGTNNIDQANFGQVAAATNIPQWYADDITINDSGYPGPAVVAPAPAEAAWTLAAQDPTVSIAAGGASPTPAEAAWSIAAGAPTVAVAPNAGGAAFSFAANNATVTTSSAPGSKFFDQFIGGYGLQLLLGFGVDVTTAPGTWSLTDVTSDLFQPEPPAAAISITFRGRADEQSTSSPTTCVFTLKNPSGNYTPRRRQGSHWPYMKVGLPCQILITTTSTHYERFSGYVDAIEPDWDETGNRAMVVVTAHGILQRLGQGTPPLRSAIERFITSGLSLAVPDAYWPMEDGTDATGCASVTAGVSRMVAVGSVEFAAAGAPGSAAVPNFAGGGSLRAPVALAAPTLWLIHTTFLPSQETGMTVPLAWKTSFGTFAFISKAGGSPDVEVTFQDDNLTLFPTTSIPIPVNYFDGNWHNLIVWGTDDGGGGTSVHIYLDGVNVGGADFLGCTFGPLRSVVVNQMTGTGTTATASDFGLGHVALYTSLSTIVGFPYTDFYSALVGYTGEDPVTRMTRLCAENAVPFVADGTSDAVMGPQTVDTLMANLRAAEAVDGGVLDDATGFGLTMHTVNGRYNAPVTFTPTLQQIAMPWQPVENNLRIRNDATVTRLNGSFARYIQPTGQPYAPDGPGGVGTYDGGSPTLNLFDDTTLPIYAGLYVNLGTVDADRYPAMGINLAARTSLLASWLPLTVSSRLTVGGQYSTGASDNPDLIIEGWSEQLSKMVYAVQVNTSPAAPWIVGVLNTDRLDCDGVTLHAGGWNGVAGTFQVDIAAGKPLCSTSAGDYPVDLNVDGQRVTVSACSGSSSPQTFTVSVASANGVSVSHAAGVPVYAWSPLRLAL